MADSRWLQPEVVQVPMEVVMATLRLLVVWVVTTALQVTALMGKNTNIYMFYFKHLFLFQ